MVLGRESLPSPDRYEDVVATAGLVNVPAAELVVALLRRAVEVLEIDAALLLAVDGSGTQLVGHTAVGLDDETCRGLRVPIGAGFAGRVAATRVAATIDEDNQASDGVLLFDHGTRVLAGVPLVAKGQLCGVLEAGGSDRAPFDADDLAVLAAIGDEVAAALLAERMREEGRAAQLMQRSLLPSRLPAVEGLELAARFVPASGLGVGGDWYDAFTTPDGHLVAVVGDVVGHALRAAVVMGRLRSVVRAYAFESGDPADVIRRVARKFAHFEPAEMATLLVAQLTPDLSEITMATAGHPPPVLAPVGGTAAFIDVPAAPPIGCVTDQLPVNVTAELPPGATLFSFTDGLFERRDVPFDQALERVAFAASPGPIEQATSAMMDVLLDGHEPEDDTALLALRRLPD